MKIEDVGGCIETVVSHIGEGHKGDADAEDGEESECSPTPEEDIVDHLDQ